MDPQLERWHEEVRWLRAVALRLVGDPEVADDLAQETALVSLRRSPELRADERGWRLGVLRQLFRNHLRGSFRRRRREASAGLASERAPPPTPAELLDQFEVHRAITDAIHALDEPYRRVVILRYFHDRSAAEIARNAGEPEATVRSRLARALERLRTELDLEFGGDRRRWLAPLVAWLALSAGDAMGASAASGLPPSPFVPRAADSALQRLLEGGLTVGAKKIAATAAALLLVGIGALWLRSGSDDFAEERIARTAIEDRAALAAPIAAEPPAETSPPLAAEARSRVLRGRVLSRHGEEPIEGAIVAFVAEEPNTGSAPARSDASGRFSIAVPRTGPGVAKLAVATDRHVPAVWEFARSPEHWPDPLPDLLLTEGTQVEGRVVDARGDPAAGAHLFAWTGVTSSGGGGHEPRRSAVDMIPIGLAGPDARFRTVLPGGTSIIAAIADGATGTVEVVLPAAPSGEILVTISDADRIDGRVVDEAGRAISGARVSTFADRREVPSEVPYYPSAPLEAVTGTDGRFQIASFGSPLAYAVRHPDHLSRYGTAEDRLRPGIESTIVLRRARILRGVFTRSDESLALPAEVALRPEPGPRVVGAVDGGDFELHGVSPESEGGVLTVGGFREVALAWPAGDGPHDLGEVALDPGLSLSVTARGPGGEPIENAGVRAIENIVGAEERLARTDASGLAKISGLSGATLELEVWAEGLLPHQDELAALAGDRVHEVQLGRPAALVGALVDSAGKPVEGAFVSATPVRDVGGRENLTPDLADSPQVSDLTDSRGRFLLRPLPPGVAIRLWFRPDRSRSADLTIDPLEEGERRDLGDLALVGTVALDVIVTDPAGRTIEGATVRLGLPKQNARDDAVVLRTDASGTARFAGLAAGAYSLIAAGAGFAASETTCELAETQRTVHTVRIALEPGASWEVAVRAADGGPVSGARVTAGTRSGATAIAVTDAEGKARVEGLPAGALHYSVDADDHPSARGEVETARQLPPEIVLPPSATVRIRIVPPRGGPAIRKGSVSIEQSSTSWGFQFDQELSVFVAKGRLPGAATVQVIAEGYPAFREKVELRAGEETEVVYAPEAPAGPFAVRILDPGGVPRTDARVRYRIHASTGGQPSFSLEELPHLGGGVYGAEIATPERHFDLLVEAAGFSPTERVEVAATDPPLEIELAPESGIDISVVDAEGAPVAGRGVQIMLLDSRSLVALATTFTRLATDADGRISLRALAPSRYTFTIADGVGGLFELAPGEIRTMEIRLPGSAEVFGKVLENGVPLARGELRVSAEGASRTLEVDDGGRFGGKVPAAERAEVTYSRRGPEEISIRFTDVPIARGEEIRLNFKAVSAEIRLVDERGAPVGPLELRITASPVGGISGSAKLSFGSDGAAPVRSFPPGRTRISGEVPEGSAIVDSWFDLADGVSITVRVHSASLLRAQIPAGIRNWSLCRVDAAGEFRAVAYSREHTGPDLAAWWFPSAIEPRTAVLDFLGRAPLVVSLPDPAPEAPFVLPEAPGGRIGLAGRGEHGAGPFALVFEAIDAPPLDAALSRRRWWGDSISHPLPVGRYRVTLAGAAGTLASEEVEVRAGETSELPW